MAARSFVQLLGAADPGVVVLGFNFTPNGTGTIASSAISGRGVASVVWNATAKVYDVTLSDQYFACLSAQASYVDTDPPDDRFAKIRAVFPSTAPTTVGVGIYDVSLADYTSVSTGTVQVLLVLKNSSV